MREGRQTVIGAVLRYADACERHLQPSQKAHALAAVETAFDALIAAVRAENERFLKAAGNEIEVLRTDAMRVRGEMAQRIADLEEAAHYATGVAELAMKHRDIAEAAVTAHAKRLTAMATFIRELERLATQTNGPDPHWQAERLAEADALEAGAAALGAGVREEPEYGAGLAEERRQREQG